MNDVRDPDLLLAQLDLSLADTRNIKEIVDQPNQVVQLTVHHLAKLVSPHIVGIAPQDIETIAKRCKWVAKLMGKSGQELVLAAVRFLQRLGLGLKLVPLLLDLLALTIEFEKDLCLMAQHIGLDRLLDKIHGSRFISLEAAALARAAGGNKDDRDAAGSLIAAHQFGKLKTVEARHLDVYQGERDIILKEDFERLVAGAGFQKIQVVATKQRFERQEVFFEIVDQQKFDGVHGSTFCR